jgi:nucleoside-diphosphate-sugar epimerase
MKVLVTGHTGYIGTILTQMLLQRGHQVVGVDTGLFAGCTFGADTASDVITINSDIRDLTVVQLRAVDAVVHLAGICNDPLGDLLPETTMDINDTATIRLAELARDAGVERFVFSSTCSVYGAAEEDWVDEASPPNPVTPYAVSKYRAEQGLLALATDRFSPVLLRSATAYGFSPRIRFDLVLNNLTAHAVTTGRVFLKSDGMAWRPLVHIADISRAFIAAVEAPREAVHCETFNVGSTAENYRVRSIAEIVRNTVPGSAIAYAEGAAADKRSYRVSFRKIESRLPNFRPQWTAMAGALELHACYTKYGLALEDFEGERYQRLAHLKSLLAAGILDRSLRRLPQSYERMSDAAGFVPAFRDAQAVDIQQAE